MSNFNKKLKQEKNNIVNKIIELYPDLDKEHIMDNLNKKNKNKDIVHDNKKEHNKEHELVVEQIEYNNKIYYKDEFGGILNEIVIIIKSL